MKTAQEMMDYAIGLVNGDTCYDYAFTNSGKQKNKEKSRNLYKKGFETIVTHLSPDEEVTFALTFRNTTNVSKPDDALIDNCALAISNKRLFIAGFSFQQWGGTKEGSVSIRSIEVNKIISIVSKPNTLNNGMSGGKLNIIGIDSYGGVLDVELRGMTSCWNITIPGSADVQQYNGLINEMVRMMNDCISNANKTVESEKTATSIPDEIIKYKQLLDMGIITQEEFDTKKKQLLQL